LAVAHSRFDREREDRVEEVQVVLDRLGRESVAFLGQQVALHAGAIDLVQRPAAKERREVLAQVAAVVGDRRALALHHVLEMVDVGRAGLLHGPPRRRATTVSLAIRRRSSASACVRVSPSLHPARRLTPRRRLTRRPPTRHDPYQVSRPLPSERTKSRPEP
jgi:hypothetical protein